ncbi:MAG: hypothetical protein V3R81_14095 [Gammaproteobacteria bacterium]
MPNTNLKNPINYKGFVISRTDPKPPIQDRSHDWSWADAETADDGPDCVAFGTAESVTHCEIEIDNHICDRQIESIIQLEPEQREKIMPLMVWLYNQGYGSGHHDTVESCYTDVLPAEMATYHDDIVIDLLAAK